jgi:hypothetical protein
MRQRIRLLQQLVRDSQYAIDDFIVANAILARTATRQLIPDVTFRNDVRPARVQSFRPTRHARSFRPCNARKPAEGVSVNVPARRAWPSL